MWDQAIERHLAKLEARGASARTIETKRPLLQAFARYARGAGVDSPARLPGRLVEQYLAYRRALPNRYGRLDTAGTLSNHLASARSLLRGLERAGEVAAGLAERLGGIRVPELLPRNVPTHEQMMTLMSAVDVTTPAGVRDRAILEVLYSTALRRAELLALGLADVDLDGGLMHVRRGKGGKARVVPMGAEAIGWTRRYLLEARPRLMRGGDAGALWMSVVGRPLAAKGLERIVKLLVARAGIGINVTPHAFRRACTTELVRAGAPLWPVKELLGHSTLGTLKRYARLTINDVREAHRKYHPRERSEP